LWTLDRNSCADVLAVLAAKSLACILRVCAPTDVLRNLLQLGDDESVATIADDVNGAATLGQVRKRSRRRRMLRWHR
jgi:hypothetical protein